MGPALRRLDANWWTSFCFFVAAVAICSSLVLYRAYVEEEHYRELFGMMVRVPPPSVPPYEAPALRAPPASGHALRVPSDPRALDI